MLRRTPLLAAAVSLTAAALPAQTVTTVPLGISIPTENTHAVTGVRIRALPDGTVWFMVPSNDRIVRMRGSTLTQWQIRTDKNIGANPVDFQFDGDVIWFICNGESQIDAGRSIFARLDTTTGALREWVLPGSKPAGFWRAPDGKVWIPQTDGRLQSLDLDTLRVDDYKSRSADGTVFTFAYSDVVYRDGALWMTDFGNNRIVRYEPGADSETSWTFLSPSVGVRLNPSQIRFDQAGHLWICQRGGFRIDEFDPLTGFLLSFGGFNSPLHFELFQGRIYVSEAPNGNGVVAVLDPNLASAAGVLLTPLTVPVRHIVNAKRALIRDSTITPTTFISNTNGFGASDLTVTAGAAGTGILFTSFNNRNAYGITVADGYVWTGSDGEIVRLLLQNLGEDQDLTVPIAFKSAADAPPLDRVDVTLANQGDSTISGNLLFLYSPASFAASVPFTVNPRSTAVLTDVFHDVEPPGVFITGAVRIQVTGGTISDVTASVRSMYVREDGANFGFALPAVDTFGGLGLGERATLFTATRDAETATLGLYTSSAGAGAQPGRLTLVAADGTVRATLDYNLANNTLEEFTPPASAFGLPAQDGDVVQISAGPGSLRAYVRFRDSGSTDIALSLPVKASGNAVLPFVTTGVGMEGTGPVSDLYLSNPDPENPAHITVSFFAGGPPAAPARAAVALPPGSATVLRDVLNSLLGLTSGSGALVVTSDIPVASALRLAARRSDGDYATVIAAYDGSQTVPAGASAFASGLQEIPNLRSTDLVLFNGGAATTATVVGFDGNGSEIDRLTIDLGAGESRRLTAVLHQLGLDGLGAIDNARVRVDALAGSQIYAAFAQTDAVSGDVEWTRPQ